MVKAIPHVLISSKSYVLGEDFLVKIADACSTDSKVKIGLGSILTDSLDRTGILSSPMFFSIEYTRAYFKSIFNTAAHSSFLKGFIKYLDPFINIWVELQKNPPSNSSPENISFISLHMDLTKVRVHFTIPVLSSKQAYEACINKAFETTHKYLTNDDSLLEQITRTFKVDGSKDVFFKYSESTNNWQIVDILKSTVDRIHDFYKKNMDKRSSKPTIFFNTGNLREYTNMGKKWVIKTPKQNYFMSKPNDVALYSSICTKNIEVAKKMAAALNYRQDSMTTFVIEEYEPQYYDLFEHVITSITAAFTAVECLVNICIDPHRKYKLKDKKGKVRSLTKSEIESRFTFEEKIKKVLPISIDVKPPVQQKWWTKFTELKKLRDEVIHSKESKAEDRYSQYLDPSIYLTIETYKQFISYYCEALLSRREDIVDKLPYGFGNEEIVPAIMRENDYIDMWNNLHNANRPKVKRNRS